METSEQIKVVNTEGNNWQKLEKEIAPKEELIRELTDMGFPEELVQLVINYKL